MFNTLHKPCQNALGYFYERINYHYKRDLYIVFVQKVSHDDIALILLFFSE